jgi:hypothetical protein
MAEVGNNCNAKCSEIYPIDENGHIKRRVGDERILGLKHQFCAAFYHVHQWYHLQERRYREHFCLDKDHCIIAKEAKKRLERDPNDRYAWCVPPLNVVAVVKFEKVDGRILYEARYTNCGANKRHAEDFFKDDIENPDGMLAEIVKENPNGIITMYLTLQPCNMSTGKTANTKPDQSCCDILKTIVRQRLRNNGRNIKLCIKATHTNRLHPRDKNTNLRQNAERGIKQLMRIEGVNVSGMTPEDWDYLFSMTEYIPPRRDLDRDVQNIFERIHTINIP